jgi:methyl-accepting chemotaxis protein
MLRIRRFSTRLLIPGILGTCCFSAVLFWSLIRIHSYAFEIKEETTRHVVELAAQTVAHFAAAESQGQMTREQAQQAALAAVRDLRYGSGGYFWINDLQPRMIMHPTNPALNGSDLSNYRDPDGLLLFMKMPRGRRRRAPLPLAEAGQQASGCQNLVREARSLLELGNRFRNLRRRCGERSRLHC